MKTFVINLERSVERRKHIVRHLKKRGFDYELIKAVDGKQLSDEDRERLCDTDALRAQNKMTSGVMGCALSHLNVYRRMIEDKIEIALILEDDVILPKNIKQLLERIENTIETDEVILLHYFSPQPSVPVLSNVNATRIYKNYKLMYPINFPNSTAGYVIKLEAARALSQMLLLIRVEADNWGYFFRNGGIKSLRCVYPKPLELTQAETEVQVCNYEGIGFRHRVWRIISDNRIPVLYPIACEYLRFKDRRQRIEVVNKQSPVVKQMTGVISAAAVEKQSY